MNPFISIVVPIYNSEAFLAETIESVLNQTYGDWELLLIDDGSTDGTADICKVYENQDNRIHYHYKTNSGQAAARNFGIKNSTGTWVSFLDSDDLWLPNKLVHQLEEIKTKEPDFLYGLGYYYYPERAEKLEAYDWVSGEMSGDEFFKILYTSCAVNTNTVLVKKSLFDQVGYFNEDALLRGTEDWDLWLRIAKSVQKIYGSPNRDVYYRIHNGGIHLQQARMLKGKAAIYAQFDKDPSIQRLVRLRQYRYTYREMLNHLWNEKRTDELKTEFAAFAKKDRFGIGTLKQRILIKWLKPATFMWVSQKIIYRVAYRLERLTYFLFVK